MAFVLALYLINRVVPRRGGDADNDTPRRLQGHIAATAPVYRASVVFPEGIKPTELGLFGGRIALSPDGTKVANVGGTVAPASDGSVLLFELGRNGRALRVSAPGAEPVELFRAKPGQATGFPRFLDDGRRFLYTQDFGPGSTDTSGADVTSLETPGTSSLVIEGRDIVNPDLVGDYLVYSNGATLMAQRFDQVRGQLVGTPYTLATDVLWAANSGSVSSASRDVLAYVPQPY